MGRAWRRPVTAQEVDQYMGLFATYRPGFATFQDAMVEVLATVLAAPDFLYLTERSAPAPGKDAKRISDAELASRLAMFLWCSIPDQQLLDLARQGRLGDPKVLGAQVERLLADPRAQRFAQNFVRQWLGVDALDHLNVDTKQYGGVFDEALKAAMKQEPIAFFDEVLAQNGNVLDFIHSDYVVINERLARHYHIEGVSGPEFRRVPVDAAANRGGIMTCAAFLAMNSDGKDSHPLKRGVWVLKRMLDDPPPPPPPNVPQVDLTNPEILKMTLKERIADHRNKPACYSCHSRIDPWGVALENYDAVGAWRTHRQRQAGRREVAAVQPAGDRRRRRPQALPARRPPGPVRARPGAQAVRLRAGPAAGLQRPHRPRPHHRAVARGRRPPARPHRPSSSPAICSRPSDQQERAMTRQPTTIDRRRFLIGSSIALMLPALESFAADPAGAAAKGADKGADKGPPRRFLSVYHPDGVGMPLKADPAWTDWSWFPRVEGDTFKLTKVLDVLEPLRGDITIYSGLSHPAARKVHGHSNADQYLTGAPVGGSGVYQNSISLDQVYAAQAGERTRFASLVLSTNGGTGAPRGAQTQSFTREGRPIPALNRPKQVFDQLFVAQDKDARAQLARSKSALDLLLASARTLQGQVSAYDKQTLTQYLDAVRDTELKLERATRWIDTPVPKVDAASLQAGRRRRTTRAPTSRPCTT